MNYDGWEAGCAADSVRNGFVVPQIVDLFSRYQPKTILDIGSLTGYIPRQIDAALPYGPAWTLLDRDPEAIQYARSKLPGHMDAQLVNLPLEDFNPETKFEAVVLTFTLLEFPDRMGVFDGCASRMLDQGHLVIALPDCLVDTIEEARSTAALDILERFVRSDVELPKIDKFTGDPYPFVAVRITRIIAEAIAAGFALITLNRHDSGDGGVFLIHLQKMTKI